jgi:L-2-hydroxyglutarate oxidase LhgO
MERVDTIIIGAGVVGLAIARVLAQRKRETLILESESAIATVTSARNSGVIHAGIYYRPGSLKARLCVEGRHALYAYAAARGIPHKKCGKLIVTASRNQSADLHHLHERAMQNGVENMRLLSAAEAQAMEPSLSCASALLSPETGVVDVHSYALALLGDAEAAGATLALQTPVAKGTITDNGFIIETGGTSPMQIGCRTLINAAGLGAQNFARSLDGLKPATIPPQVLAKGNYFSLSGPSPFTRLIYPLPVLGSSGLHAMCDMGGQTRFGPDVEWVDHIDYRVDPVRVAQFEEVVRCYWPALPGDALQPDYCGIRPKIARGSPHDTDFMIQTPRDHGVPGLINLYGIESPGLTSSLAIAECVAAALA